MLTRSLRDAIKLTRGNEARRSDLTAQVRTEHAEMSAAIEARDPARARQAAFLHMRNTEERISKAELGFWTEDSRTAAQRLAGADLATVLRRAVETSAPKRK
jgi:hypothetical protein